MTTFVARNKFPLLIAFLGTLWAICVIILNVHFSTDHSIQKGIINTADDISYKAPAENFLRQGEWKDNFNGASSFMQRTPGMGIIHLFAICILPQNPEIIHLFIHFLLHFLALLVLYKVLQLKFSDKSSSVITLLYAFLPCFWGYLNYFLTESITPSLIILIYGSYIYYEKTKNIKWILIQSIFIFILSIVRIQLVLFTIPFIIQIIKLIYSSKMYFKPILILVFAFSGITIWQIRNTVILKGWPGLHPIYHETNQTLYRPVHQSLGELYKIWEEDGAKFHQDIAFISEIGELTIEDREKKIKSIIHSFPEEIILATNEKYLVELFSDYSIICKEVKNGNYRTESEAEKKLKRNVKDLISKLKSEFRFQNYFLMPIKSAVFLFSKSQLNQPIFQKELRGNWGMEILRFFCVLIINLSFIGIMVGLFLRNYSIGFTFNLMIVLYLFYLIFIQVMNEERYLVPLLPLMYIQLTNYLKIFWNKKNRLIFTKTK